MKKKKALIIAVAISIFVILLSLFLLNRNSNITSYKFSNEIKRASSYNEITDNDYEIDNCEYVRFNAFFIRDLDRDGYAEKYDGTCNYIDKSTSLYFDINVLTDGTLKNGNIAINGKNFNLSTTIVKDEVIKNDYIGTNINNILLKDINYGTQKLFSGTIKANIGNNINNYSREDNTVVLTGTWVSTDGSQTIDINKTITLKADWYGVTSTSVYTGINTSHNIESVIGTENIILDFSVGYREIAEELLIQKQVTEVTIPDFNGYAPTQVTVDSQNCNYEYNEETKILTISRQAVVDKNGNITSSVSRTNIYDIKVMYPLEAYENLGSETISITFPTKGYYYGYNNSSEEFSTENPYVSSASRSWTHIWKPETEATYSASFDVYVGKYTYNQDTKSYRYIISKELPLKIYNNLGENEEISDEYIVQWRAYTGNTFENQNGIYMEENGEDKFLDSSSVYSSMNEYISTKGIYFSNVDGILSENGYIKVYDRDTEELLVTFTKDNWSTYTSSNPYYFDKTVKGIKFETSKANGKSYLYVYQIKEIDDEKLTTDFTYEEFENLNYIYSYLKGSLFSNDTKTQINTSQNYAYYEAPVSIARFSISPTAITNQETKAVTMTITTQASYYNESKWKNGYFVIELPEEILEVTINNVASDNSNVEIISYETYEENGKQYIKIYTKNEEEDIYNLTINADITADPRIATTTKSINLYAVNENCPNYRTTSRIEDVLDINGNSNVEEYVLYKTASLQIVAPSSLLTSQTLTDFDDSNQEVVSPQIAILDKSDNTRDAKINVSITNNYSGTISEAKIIGKIPFEGNTYQINGKDLGSSYSVTIKNTGINLPDAVRNIAKVYYSTNEIVNKNIEDETNNWKTAEEVTDWNNIKTYIIDLSDYVLNKKEALTFTYEIELPANINYNDIAYSTHAVYFCLDTEDGKLKTSTEVNRLGIMIAKKYSISLTKYKSGTETLVKGATYKITDGVQARTGITDENGNITISGLYVDKEYTLSEIQTPDSYILNEDEVKFKLIIDSEGNPIVNIISGSLKDTATVSNNNGNYIVNLAVEDVAKYDVKLNKTDEATRETIKGAKFKLTGGIYGTNGRIFTTNNAGEISIINLVPGVEYSLQETKADGYYVNNNVITFTVLRNSNGNLEITSSLENVTIAEENGVDKAVVSVNFTNEAIPTYNLNVNKTDDEGKVLQGTQFKITSVDTGNVNYVTTDEEGKATLEGLYQYVEGKYITGEYILQEIVATEGYITDTTEVKFKAENADGILNISILEGEEAVVSSSSDSNTITLNFKNKPIFNLTKTGDNGELLPNAVFKITDLDGNYVTDINGNAIGELVGFDTTDISFTSSGKYTWSQREDGTWESTGNYNVNSSTSTLTSNNFILPEDATLSFDWSVSSENVNYDYVYYTITNINTNETIGGTSTRIGGTSYGTVYDSLKFNTVSIDLSAGTYKIEFTYRKDKSQHRGLDAGFVRNVKVSGNGYYALTTNEEGKITANLPEGLYKLTEVEAPEGYSLAENEEDRTYYVGVGKSKAEESEFKMEWAKSLSGTGFSNINDIKATSDGGYVIAGSFEGELDLNNDSETDIISTGDLDAIIAKYDKSGNLEWYTSYGDSGADEFYSVSLTQDGGYAVSGYEYTDNYEDGLIIKFDSSGNQVWKNALVGELKDEARDVEVLSTGDIAVVGRFYSTTINLADGITLSNFGNYDGFVACYGADGTYKWSNVINGRNNIDVSSVTETSQGIVISANFSGNINLNGSTITSVGKQDAILVAYSLTGEYQWHSVIGGLNDESIEKIVTDEEDNIIAVGSYSSDITLGSDNLDVDASNYTCALAVKYSSIGEYISNYNFGNTTEDKDDKITSVVATKDGGMLLGGWFYGRVDINGDGGYDYKSNDIYYGDGIIIKLDDAGEVEWSRNVAGSSYEVVYGVAELEDSGIVAVGNFNSSTISCGDSSSILTMQGYNDSFMIKLGNVVTAAEIPELQQIEIENELQTFNITTEIGENSDEERVGGTITGTETSEENIKLVETVKYGYDSTTEIIITPDENYSIYTIRINGKDYSFTPNEDGKVTIPIFENVKENYHIQVVFEKDLSNILVHHYLKDRNGNYTTTSLAEDEYLTDKIGNSYITSPKIDIDGYELEKDVDGNYIIPENSVGNYTEEQIEVIYYYEEIPLTLTVHHYLEGTEDNLVEDEIYSIYKGEEYKTLPNSTLLESYTLVEDLTTVNPENAETSGILNENTVVTYYYKLQEHSIRTKVNPITISVLNENTNEVEEISVFGGTVLGENQEPYEEVIYGNDSTKAIIATPDNGFVVKSITVNGEKIEFTVNADRSVTLSNFVHVTEDKEVVVEFEAILGTVIVHHYIEGTTLKVPLLDGKVAEDEIKKGYVGNLYATKSKENISEGYELVSTPSNSSGKYTENTNEVAFYYATKEFNYTVEYYYDGIIDESKTETFREAYQDIISTYTDKNITGYKLEKTENLPLTISSNEAKNVIKVYYVIDDTQTKELSYTVEYYKDGVKVESDTQTVKSTVQVLQPNTLTVDKSQINTVDKYTGYKFEKSAINTEEKEIPNTVNNGDVIKVYYVIDDAQTKELSYTVEYYKDNVKVESDTQTVKSTVQVLQPDTLTVDKAQINTVDKYTGYKLDKTELNTEEQEIPDTVNNGDVIKVYYVIDDTQTKELSYTVEYYKDNVKVESDTQTVKSTVQVLQPDTLTVDKAQINTVNKYTGYKLDKTELNAEEKEIPNTVNNGDVIKVYYVIDEFSYTVKYYYDGILDESKTETLNATYQEEINTYIDKTEYGYKFEKTENLPLTISENVEENIINVYYVRKDAQVIVKYVDKNTDEELSENVIKTGKVFDEFDVSGDKKEIEYYTLVESPNSTTGTYTEETQTKTYYYAKNTQVIVKYLEKDDTPEDDTDNQVLASEEIIEGYIGKEYTTKEKDITNYTFVENTNNITGTMSEETITVVYYYLQNTKVVVNHIDKNTGVVLEKIVKDGIVGDKYTSTSKEFENYVLIEIPENETVIMTKEVITLNYYYVKVSAGVAEKHINIVTKEILYNELHKGNEGDEYSISSKEFENYQIITNNMYYSIDKNLLTEIEKYTAEEQEELKLIYGVSTLEELVANYKNEMFNKILEDKELNAEDAYIPENYEGVMTTELIEVVYYYIRPASVKVTYVDEITGAKIDTPDYIYGYEKDEYKTQEKDIEDYILVEEKYPSNAEGTMEISINEDETICTETTVVYYYVHKAKVIEKHIDVKTNELLETETIYDGYEGKSYSTNSKEFTGYDLIEEQLPENSEGTMSKDVIVVNYYYIRKVDVVAEYIDKNTGENLSELIKLEDDTNYKEVDSTEHIYGHEGDSYKTEEKQFKNYVFVETTNNTEGTMEISVNPDGTVCTTTYVKYYYAHISGGVIEQHIDIITGELLEKETTYEGKEGDPYSTSSKIFEGYDLVETKLPSNAEGTMTKELIEVKYYYIKKVKVIVEHLELDTNKKLLDDETIDGHEGDSYKTNSKDIAGYYLVTSNLPKNAEGTMEKDDIKVTYYYKTNSTTDENKTNTPTVENKDNKENTDTTSDNTNKVYTPATGDNIPAIALGTIFIVVMLNIIQIKLSKSKNRKEK